VDKNEEEVMVVVVVVLLLMSIYFSLLAPSFLLAFTPPHLRASLPPFSP
jgi:hypothetical protein